MDRSKWEQYRKAFVAWAIPVVLAVQSVVTDGITEQEWFVIILAVLGAGAVQAVPNEPTSKQIKDIAKALGVGGHDDDGV